MWFVLVEQALLEHGAQTPPPSPFSVQAFNRAATSNGAQGFDYGISNNKGEVKLVHFQEVVVNLHINFLSNILIIWHIGILHFSARASVKGFEWCFSLTDIKYIKPLTSLCPLFLIILCFSVTCTTWLLCHAFDREISHKYFDTWTYFHYINGSMW